MAPYISTSLDVYKSRSYFRTDENDTLKTPDKGHSTTLYSHRAIRIFRIKAKAKVQKTRRSFNELTYSISAAFVSTAEIALQTLPRIHGRREKVL